MHWPRIRGLCSVSCSVWLRANGTEISGALWAVRYGKDFTLFTLLKSHLTLICIVLASIVQYTFLSGMHGDFVILMYNYRKQIQEINWQRKNEQTDAGAKLKQLEER